MNQLFIRSTARTGLVAMAMLVASASAFAHTTTASDERSLARGAVEDVTAQQKYRNHTRAQHRHILAKLPSRFMPKRWLFSA